MKDRHLKAALWYADHNWHVIPLHEPLFGADGRCCGCSCEDWKRENMRDKFGQVQTDYVCGTPGKHPRHNAWEEIATTDPEQIGKWWRAWPTANVGIAAGKSGLVCLDADTYKSGGEWSHEWGQTVTNLTGGGGEHLIFAHPPGEPIGGSSKGLPNFVDVRAHGGLFVAPPSMHPSGRRYEWETDYGPHEVAPAVLPEPIADILRTAVKVEPAQFTGQAAAIDWERFGEKLSGLTLAVLNDDRSKIDFWLIRSLLWAGATADEILTIWQQRDPTGKFTEKGRHGVDYLGRTIANAQAHINEKKTPDIQPQQVAA